MISFLWLKVLTVPVAFAQATAATGGPSQGGASIVPLSQQVTNIYNLALLLGGLLAFGAVVYGAARYTLSAGSPSAQSDARDQITQALIGLVLLLGAYIVLNTINPSLTSFNLPVLKEIKPPAEATSTGAGGGLTATCAQSPGGCVNSGPVTEILGCLAQQNKSAPATTFQGTHHANSCHFGGSGCTDGSHAIDWGFNGLNSQNISPPDMVSAAEQCGASRGIQISCRYEDEGGNNINLSWNDPRANHIHCNVDNQLCGCN